MSRSTSESEFDSYVVQNQQTMLGARGATSMYRPVDAPVGIYYAMINKATRGMTNRKDKGPDGKDTGTTSKIGQGQCQVILICDADPKTPVGQRELVAGIQGYIQWNLHDQASWDRYFADLEAIGVPTRNFVPSESMITNPATQLTLAQGLEMINRHKPFGIVTITQPSGSTSKFINFRDSIKKEDIEMYLGHPIDMSQYIQAASQAETVQRQYMAPDQGQPQMGQTTPVLPGMGNQMPVTGGTTQYPNIPMTQPGMPSAGMAQPPFNPTGTYTAQAAPAPGWYPQAGHPFAGNPATLQPQPDGTYFDTFSKHFYSQTGQFIPVSPPMPVEPVAQQGHFPGIPSVGQAMPALPGMGNQMPGMQVPAQQMPGMNLPGTNPMQQSIPGYPQMPQQPQTMGHPQQGYSSSGPSSMSYPGGQQFPNFPGR